MASVSFSRELWDPYRVLNIYPNDPGFTCVGIAKSTGSRCRWTFDSEQFRISQRATVVKSLKSMSEMQPSDITPAALYSLAQSTLCRDFHQWQANAKSTEWKAKVEGYLREHSERPAVFTLVKQLRYEPDGMEQLQNGIAKLNDASEQEIKLERMTAELKTSQTRWSEMTENNNKLERDQAANSRDVAMLRLQLTEFQTKAKTLDERNVEIEELRKQLEERNANFGKDIAAGRKEIASLKAKNQDRERALDERARTSEEEAQTLRQQLEASSGELAILREAKASSEERARLSEEDVERVHQELQELQDSNARQEALEAKNSKDLRRKLEALSQRYTVSKNENKVQTSRLQEEMKEVKQELAKRDQHLERLVEQKEGMNKELANRDQQVKQLAEQKEEVKRELAEREVGGRGKVKFGGKS